VQESPLTSPFSGGFFCAITRGFSQPSPRHVGVIFGDLE
jgi:hypothetical protein